LIADHLLKYHQARLYRYQWRIWRGILTALIENLLALTGADITEEDIAQLQAEDMAYEYTRQSGKTTVIVHTVETIMVFVGRLFDMPIHIGIFAPQREQAKTDFDRLKAALMRSKQDLTVVEQDAERTAREESNAKTLVLANGCSCYIFPVTPASKPEGKTLHLIILEEAQDLMDIIVNEQIMPMGASTNAPVIRVGTAGTVTCDFYWSIQKGNAYVMTYPEIARDRRALYDATGDARHLIYEQKVKKDIEKYGETDPRIQRPYFNVWQLQAGMYIMADQLYAGRVVRPFESPGSDPVFRSYRDWRKSARRTLPECETWATSHNIPTDQFALYRAWTEENHYFGLDTAKASDQTVLKIGRMVDGRLTIVRSLQGMYGLNYQDQFDIITAELQWFNIAAGSIDATGQGDFMPDLFERGTGYRVFRVPFSRQSKDHMYTALYQKQVGGAFAYYYQDYRDPAADQYTAKASAEYEEEFIQLTKNYIGEYMVVKHPDAKNAHDDHADATALMNNAYDSYNVSAGILDFYKKEGTAAPAAPFPPGKMRGRAIIDGRE
jgi:hypothetical protein